MEPKETQKNVHHGHAIKRFRHALGVKQEALAAEMGVSQAQVSAYEQKPVIEDEMIERFARALNIAPTFIKELEEDPVTIIIESNTFDKGNNVGNTAPNGEINNNENFGNTYNPLEEVLKLSQDKQALYERMLELEKEKSAILEKLLKEKK